jgi:predicted lysophospholipase L1 biosynthesis ABC-type transport system permease subunit
VLSTQIPRLRSWPWMLGAASVGVLLLVVAPPLGLILLIAFGIFAVREQRQADGNHVPLAIFVGLAVVACLVVLSLL